MLYRGETVSNLHMEQLATNIVTIAMLVMTYSYTASKHKILYKRHQKLAYVNFIKTTVE